MRQGKTAARTRPMVLAAFVAVILAAAAAGEILAETAIAPDDDLAANAPLLNGTFKAEVAGQKLILPAVTLEGVPFISLKGMAAALGGSLTEGKRPGDLAVSLAGRLLEFSSEHPSLVMLDSVVTSLSREAQPLGGDLYVPSDFIARVVSPMLDEPTPAGESPLDVKIVGAEGTMQLVFECPREVRYVVDEGPRAVTLRLEDASLTPPWSSRVIGSPILESVTFEGPRAGGITARLEKGKGFASASSFELHNPYRIVVELRGRDAPGVVTGTPVEPSIPAVPRSYARSSLRSVIIDPGHGGESKGAEGASGLMEKEVTLDVARRLARLLRDAGLRVVLTRDEDVDLDLIQRTALANRERGDLFLSIHVNASPRRDARGAETYYLAYQSLDRESGELAAIENSGAGTGAREQLASSGVDLVLWDLAQAEHLRDSSQLAETVQSQLNGELDIRDRGVKQAPFRVLMGATMPAVLVEIGFASNPAEETALQSSAYRDRIAGALARSVLEFKETFDRRQGIAPR